MLKATSRGFSSVARRDLAPSLSALPAFLRRLDFGQFASLTRDQRRALHTVSNAVRSNVVAYRQGFADGRSPGHLCRSAQPAKLLRGQLKAISVLEQRFGSGVVLVAYSKPWRARLRLSNHLHS